MGEELSGALKGIPKEQYTGDHAGHMVTLYRMYVEMAVRITDRRQNANTIFIIMNTAFVTLLGAISPLAKGYPGMAWYVLVCCAAMVCCCAWSMTQISLRKLNNSKFTVVREIEQLLPLKPYHAESTLTAWGTPSSPYHSLERVENVVPWVFFALYMLLMLITTAHRMWEDAVSKTF